MQVTSCACYNNFYSKIYCLEVVTCIGQILILTGLLMVHITVVLSQTNALEFFIEIPIHGIN